MSRIGKQPVILPAGVTVVLDASTFTVTGPKGNLIVTITDNVTVSQEDDKVIISRKDDEKQSRAEHGLIRSLIQNSVDGVYKGFSKVLEINGVGYKVNIAGKKITLNLGHSHPIEYMLPEDVEAKVEENKITVSGIDKQKVGQVAAEIRSFRKPEPYKGKGIKYEDEYIIRKAGKAAGAE